MESNPVGSINFDANELYLDEESENEQDDKQQDNEVCRKKRRNPMH